LRKKGFSSFVAYEEDNVLFFPIELIQLINETMKPLICKKEYATFFKETYFLKFYF